MGNKTLPRDGRKDFFLCFWGMEAFGHKPMQPGQRTVDNIPYFRPFNWIFDIAT